MRLFPLLLLLACDANFSVAREDLGPFRLAAIGTARDADGNRVAAAALYSGEGLTHERSPTLSWTLDGEPLGEGFDVAVPDSGELGLVATAPDGSVQLGTVTIAESPATLSVARAEVEIGDDVSLSARLAAATAEVDTTVASGRATRLTLSPSDGTQAADAATTRWMSAEGLGTILTVDRLVADIVAEEIVFDDGAVESRTALGDGLYHQLALVLDGAGGNAWIWADAAMGIDEPLLRHAGRLLPVSAADAAVAAGQTWVVGTISASDDLAGVSLTDVALADDGSGAADLSLQDVLPCAPDGQPFQLDWLAEGRCARPDVLDARVVLELW